MGFQELSLDQRQELEQRREQFSPVVLTRDILVERGFLPEDIKRSNFWAAELGGKTLARRYPRAYWLNDILRDTPEYKLVEMISTGSNDVYLVEFLVTGKFPETIVPLGSPAFHGSGLAEGSFAEKIERSDLRNETLDFFTKADLPQDILKKALVRTALDLSLSVLGQYHYGGGQRTAASQEWYEKAGLFGEPMEVAEAKSLLAGALDRESGRITGGMVGSFQEAIPEDWITYGHIYTNDGFRRESTLFKVLANHGWPIKLYPWHPWKKDDQVRAWINPKSTDGLDRLTEAINNTPEYEIAYLVENEGRSIPMLEILLGLRPEAKSEKQVHFRPEDPVFLKTHQLPEEIVRAVLKRTFLQTAALLRSYDMSSWYTAEECAEKAKVISGEPLTAEQMIGIVEAAYQRVSKNQPELVNPPKSS